MQCAHSETLPAVQAKMWVRSRTQSLLPSVCSKINLFADVPIQFVTGLQDS